MKRRAFTLVELLVVIAIIGLLSTVAVVSTNSARAQARNAKRIADIKQLINALNLGLDSVGALPRQTTDNWYCLSTACTGEWTIGADTVIIDPFLSPFMATKPVDPIDGTRTLGGYLYNGNWAGNGGAFPVGSYIEYAVEKINTNQCPMGGLWADRGTFIQCMIKLDR